ncbi:MAG: hypothetical protein ACD_34C00459G0001 [uncultured bacterium]|nr:MAG: hypothetical protein ACD_34C00459G0001 [uncultured bacterium]
MQESLEATKEFVVNGLAKMVDRDLIVKEVCLRQNCFWEEGESLVNRIESENRSRLEKSKSPLMLILSSLFATAGLVWALFSFYGLVAPIYLMWKEHRGLVHGALWIYNFWSLFPFLLMSTGMTISGIFGVIHSVKRLRGEDVEEPI